MANGLKNENIDTLNPDNSINFDDWLELVGGEYKGWGTPPGWNETIGNNVAQAAEELFETQIPKWNLYGGKAGGDVGYSCSGFTEFLYEQQGLNPVPISIIFERLYLTPGLHYRLFEGKSDFYSSPRSLDNPVAQTLYVVNLHEDLRTGLLVDLIRWVSSKNLQIVTAIDPNDKFGVAGFDKDSVPDSLKNHYITPGILSYQVNYENLPAATAAAQEVLITDQLDSNLVWSSFAFNKIQIGEKNISVSGRNRTYSTTVDLRPEFSTVVHVNAQFDPQTGLASWLLKGVDPYSGDFSDMLPPNVEGVAPKGEGWVSYTVETRSDLPTDTVIRNKSTIDFEVDIPPEPIVTPEIFHTIDSDVPSSQILSVDDAPDSTRFTLQWTGSDIGAGILDYSIYLSEDNGPFTPWLTNTTDTTAIFTGQRGHTYAFYSLARDGVGHTEEIPLQPDVTLQLGSNLVGDFDGNGEVAFPDFVLFLRAFTKDDRNTGWDVELAEHPSPGTPYRRYDLDEGGSVDFVDFVTFIRHFGNTDEQAGKLASNPAPGINGKTGVTMAHVPGKIPGHTEVIVRITDATNVQGYHLKVRYDPSALEMAESEGPRGSYIPNSLLIHTGDEDNTEDMRPPAIQVIPESGTVVLADVLRPESALRGDRNLVRMRFQVLDNTSQTHLEITDVLVSDGAGAIDELMGVRLEDIRAVPNEYALSQNYPNPFNPSTRIPYQLPNGGHVRLVVYNILGQQVRTLVNDQQERGYHEATWDGKNDAGQPIASGVYLVQMRAAEFGQIRKILLLK